MTESEAALRRDASVISQDAGDCDGRLEAIREQVRGTSINDETLLTTDYLNRFNEIQMVIDLIAEDRGALDEVRNWKPVSYQEHFHRSQLAFRELAVEAYEQSPDPYRREFDSLIECMNDLIRDNIVAIEKAIAADDQKALQAVSAATREQLDLMLVEARAIVNAGRESLGQDAIDDLF
ncbi:MAG: hypothetical protein RIE31_06225 [Alphaproteobacteria bacterium]